MVTITTNIDRVLNNLAEKIQKLKDKDYLLRPVAQETIANMKQRIHKDGLASDNAAIGTYSTGYMKLRTGNYGNSERFKKGAKKGFIKNAGIVTKKKVQLYGTTQSVFADITPLGKAREKFGLGNDPKVIVKLTGKLEQDWQVIATEKGYAIGFNSPSNTQKAKWVEETYNKKIFKLTEKEKEYIQERLIELTDNALNT